MSTALATKPLNRLLWLLGSAAITAAAYLLFLGWNATKSLAPEEPGSVGTECVGPYEPWQVIALAAVLAVVVVAGTWFRHQVLVPAVVVATVVILFTIDAVTVDDLCSDTNLLPIGVFLLLAGSSAAAAVLVAVTHGIRSNRP
jgi:hypothetical protein